MDQVKAQLAVMMKYGFWISTVLVLLGSVAVWYMSTKHLAEETEKQTNAIKGAVSQVKSTKEELPTLPNDYSHKEMDRLITARQQEVLDSWQLLYQRQQKILKWPVAELKQDFVNEYEGKLPIENHIPFPTEEADELETTLRSRYATYIKNVLPDIAAIGKTEWTAQFEQASMAMGMMDSMGGYGYGSSRTKVGITGAEIGPVVQWDSGSQQTVLKDLFPWRGQLPTTLEVYYSQENLWILRQLMEIVADVNGEASQPFQAKIREIRQIGIGKSVKFGAGTITAPGTRRVGMGMMGGMEMEMEMDFEMDFSEMEMSGGDTAVAKDPAENRYINPTTMEPITGEALRSALTSNSPSDASIAVAKRVPVMMSVVMDQRAVPEFVAACGSAPLMVEVRQVRVLPKKATASTGMMGGGDMDMDMEGGMEGMEAMMMGGMGGSSMAAPPTEPVEEFPLDMAVEIYGIIYIYNPPDEEKLGVAQITKENLDEATGTAAAETGATAVTPAPATTTDDDGELPTPQADDPTTEPTPPTTTPPATTPPAATPPAATPPTTTPPAATAPPTAMLPVATP